MEIISLDCNKLKIITQYISYNNNIYINNITTYNIYGKNNILYNITYNTYYEGGGLIREGSLFHFFTQKGEAYERGGLI